MLSRLALAATALGLVATPSYAQQQHQWKPASTIPKGANMPAGVKADILGIELGATFAEAKAALQKLAAEGEQPRRPVQEETGVAVFPLPNGQTSKANFGQRLILQRLLPGKTADKPQEGLMLVFSRPSSGNQLVALVRDITYESRTDQPLISEIAAALDKKFGGKGYVKDTGNAVEYGYPFTNGVLETVNACQIDDSKCAVSLVVQFTRGPSSDHAKKITFKLTDNARKRANDAADEAYKKSFQDELNKGKGTAPKL